MASVRAGQPGPHCRPCTANAIAERFVGSIRRELKGVPAPIQAGKRWPMERLHSWMNGYGKLRRCTDKLTSVVQFYLYLAATFTVIRRLINEARHRYRWPTRQRMERRAAGHRHESDRAVPGSLRRAGYGDRTLVVASTPESAHRHICW
jgi:hypothetical protein